MAEARPSAATLAGLAAYRYLAGDAEGGDAAAERALAAAPNDEREMLREQLAAAKRQARTG